MNSVKTEQIRTISDFSGFLPDITVKKPRIILVNAHDDYSLPALASCCRLGFASGILLGNREKITEILKRIGESPDDYRIIEFEGTEAEASRHAFTMIRNGEADIPMKGLLQTSAFLGGLLEQKEYFLDKGALLSQITVSDTPARDRLVLATDCAINISPNAEQSNRIIGNAVKLAKELGIKCPKVALLAPVEKISEKIYSTVLAKEISDSISIPDCNVQGPMALDAAVSMSASQHKGISGEVAGQADILFAPDLTSGNILTKSLVYFANLSSASAICGARMPIIMTSRTDTVENKKNSIYLALISYNSTN